MDQGDHQNLIDRIEKLEALLFDLSNRIDPQNQVNGTHSPSLEESVPLSKEDNSTGVVSSPPSPLITFDDEAATVVEPVSPLSHPLITFDDDSDTSATEGEKPDKEIHNSELWLNRIGVVLLLLGLGFLFKYSIDRNWITPEVRVAFGIALGIGLIVFGLRMEQSRRTQSHFLLGGGVAAFYISGYAAFQMYHLVPHYFALSLMSGTSLLAFYLALRQNVAGLSLVAVLGGLATPFLLHTGSGNIPGLVVYTCLVLCAGMAIFYFRPWRSLLWSSWAGGWLVFGIAIDRITHANPDKAFHSWAVQGGLLFICLLYWIAPLLQKKSDWNPVVPAPPSPIPSNVFEHLAVERNSPATSVVLFSPVIAFIFSKSIWTLSDLDWGIALATGCALYTLAALALWQGKARGELTALHASAGTLMGTLALLYLLDDDPLFLTWAVEAALLTLAGRKLKLPPVGYAGTVLFGILGLWFIGRMFETPAANPVFNGDAAINFGVLLLAAFSATQSSNPNLSRAYGLYAYLGFLTLLLKELSPLANSDGLVSIVWGISGCLALAVGLRRKNLDVFKTGFGTLILVACKLLIIDLAHLEVLWRILVFLGFGGAFLLISYWMKDQWSPNPVETQPQAP